MTHNAATATSATEARPTLRAYRDPEDEMNGRVERDSIAAFAAAKRYSPGGRVDPDLYQTALLALVEAVKSGATSDPKSVRMAVRRAVEAEVYGTVAGVVSLPPRANRERLAVARAREALAGRLGRRATAAEVCDRLRIAGTKRANVEALARLLDARDGRAELPGLAGSDGRADQSASDDREALRRAVASLPARQREAVSRRYGLDSGPPCGTPGELGAAMGCEPETARRSLRNGLRRLRTLMGVGNA